jgi:protease-4
MNPILSDILNSTWLINDERKDVYASLLFSLMNGEKISDVDTSIAREKNRSYVISGENTSDRYPMNDESVPEGSIAVIPIRGEIMKYDQPCGPRGSASIVEEIKAAGRNENIKRILLVIDSPGGQVAHVDILADTIKNSETPIVAYIEDKAGSAAYWIASAASKIICSSDLDRVGSIGAMLSFADLQPHFEKMGVKFHEVYASKSTDKNKVYRDMLAGKYDGVRRDLLDVINAKFMASVTANRPNLDASVLTGKMYFAPEAIKLGLIDEIGNFDYALLQASQDDDQDENQDKPPFEEPEHENENLHSKSNIMKVSMKSAWTAIAAFFSIPNEEVEGKELTEDMLGQLNDRLADQSAKITELETSFQDERAAKLQLEEDLATAQSTIQSQTKQIAALKLEDAGSETLAGKKKDKIDTGAEEVVFAHNAVADQFLG